MTGELVQVFHCGCKPNFVYKSRQTFRTHLRSTHHQLWQEQKDTHNLREKIVQLQNELSACRTECVIWKQQAIHLKQRYEPTDLLLD